MVEPHGPECYHIYAILHISWIMDNKPMHKRHEYYWYDVVQLSMLLPLMLHDNVLAKKAL